MQKKLLQSFIPKVISIKQQSLGWNKKIVFEKNDLQSLTLTVSRLYFEQNKQRISNAKRLLFLTVKCDHSTSSLLLSWNEGSTLKTDAT